MQNDYMTTTDRAAAIRLALKAKGYSSRQVSVRAESFSMGSAIRITIKDSAVPRSLVREIAEPHESIRRCEITGDILSGGNTYLSIDYTREARLALAKDYIDAVQDAFSKVTDLSLIPVDGTPFMVGRGWNGGVSVLEQVGLHCEHRLDASSVGEAAIAIGERMVGRTTHSALAIGLRNGCL